MSFFVVLLPIVLVANKEQGPALIGIVQDGIEFVYAPRQAESVDVLGKASHQIVPGEGPDLPTWRDTGKETGLSRVQSFLQKICFQCNVVLYFEAL